MKNYNCKRNTPKLLCFSPQLLLQNGKIIPQSAARSSRASVLLACRNHSPSIYCTDAQTRLGCSLC